MDPTARPRRPRADGRGPERNRISGASAFAGGTHLTAPGYAPHDCECHPPDRSGGVRAQHCGGSWVVSVRNIARVCEREVTAKGGAGADPRRLGTIESTPLRAIDKKRAITPAWSHSQN